LQQPFSRRHARGEGLLERRQEHAFVAARSIETPPPLQSGLGERKDVRRHFGDKKYGPELRTDVSWCSEAYTECVDTDNYMDFALAADEIDAGTYWEAMSYLHALMSLLKRKL